MRRSSTSGKNHFRYPFTEKLRALVRAFGSPEKAAKSLHVYRRTMFRALNGQSIPPATLKGFSDAISNLSLFDAKQQAEAATERQVEREAAKRAIAEKKLAANANRAAAIEAKRQEKVNAAAARKTAEEQRKAAAKAKRTTAALELKRKVETIIGGAGGVEQAVLRLKVHRTTLRKILTGEPLSRVTLSRLVDSFEAEIAFDTPVTLPTSDVDPLRQIHELYLRLGTLQAVADNVGLTREAVRQKLNRGHRLGLFPYSNSHLRHRYGPFIPKRQLIADLMSLGGTEAVARKWHARGSYLRMVYTAFAITPAMRRKFAIYFRKNACHHDYSRICRALGKDASPMDLNKSNSAKALYERILVLWKRWKPFALEHRDWKPDLFPLSNSNRRQRQSEVAFQKRMFDLEIIRECLRFDRAVTVARMSKLSGFAVARTDRLLRLLVISGEVTPVRTSQGPRYSLRFRNPDVASTISTRIKGLLDRRAALHE